jgi:hypothetical protein
MIRISPIQVGRAFALSLILWAPVALAADAPAIIHPSIETVGDEVEAIQVPAIPVLESELPTLPEQTARQSVVIDPLDKGSAYTDGSIDLTVGPPPALELGKLAMGRAAVDAARRAGTLFVPAVAGPDITPEETEAMKLERLAATPPAPVVADPAAGSGVETAPVQKTGPVGLTPAEIEKLGKETK